MKIAVGCDHGGFELKTFLVQELKKCGHEVFDAGALKLEPGDDYPDVSKRVAQAVQSGQAERGVIICGSGVGAGIAANKLRGIRAALCHDTFSAHQGVEDDNMNVLCFGGRVIGPMLALDVLKAFLNAAFSGLERHQRRLAKIAQLEAGKE
jgi:ribose 5-phosphate isomerase B